MIEKKKPRESWGKKVRGQFMAGLHVLWLLLSVGITCKKGVGTATGTVKGLVEFFLGSTHGVVIVLVSVVQGALVDIVLFSDSAKKSRNLALYSVAGAVSAASNVIVFQSFFFSGVPLFLIAMLCMLAAASGIIFGSWLCLQLLSTLEHAGIVQSSKPILVDVPEDRSGTTQPLARKSKRLVPMAIVAVFLAAFTVGAVYYYAEVYTLGNSNAIQIGGQVSSPYEFFYDDFKEGEVTISAELNGAVTHEPPRNYTGIPLSVLLTRAGPHLDASSIVVSASDGYSANFPLAQAMSDAELILVNEGGSYRIVAANFEGAYWVEGVVTIEVK